MTLPFEDRGVEPTEGETEPIETETPAAFGAVEVGEHMEDGIGEPAALEDDRGGD